MSTIQIYHGHVLAALRALPERSQHAAVTSPPYYGLRRYPCPPQIWGLSASVKENCDHKWGSSIIEVHRGATGAGSTLDGTEASGRIMKVDHGAFCSICNAWRGQLGLEPDPQLYIEHMRLIFREVWRVLRDDGTLWVNIGDSYYNWRPGRKDHLRGRNKDALESRKNVIVPDEGRRQVKLAAYKEKDLMGIPHMLKDALRNDGWYWRDEIVWHKPNKMPGSQRDRCTRNHEFIFMFAKRHRYYYDQVAIMEPVTGGANGHGENPVPMGWQTDDGSHRDIEGRYPRKRSGKNAMRGSKHVWRENDYPANREDRDMIDVGNGALRIKRSVWTMVVRTQDVGGHTATFCAELPNEAIRAATSERGACPTCGKQWIRVTRKGAPLEAWKAASGGDSQGEYHGEPKAKYDDSLAPQPSQIKANVLAGMREIVTVGWYPTCRHYKVPKLPKYPRFNKNSTKAEREREIAAVDDWRARLCLSLAGAKTVPPRVLDIFAGVMTTAIEASRLQRDSTMIELADEYVEDGHQRLYDDAALLNHIEVLRP